MNVKKNIFVFIICVLCFSPVLVSAKIGNYGILNESTENSKTKSVNNYEIDDVHKTSNNISNTLNTNKSVEVLIILSLIFGGFAVTSGVLYKFVLKKDA